MRVMKRALADYRVISFDCYGTLIDWETGIWDALQPMLVANGRNDVVRAVALQAFARYESDLEARNPGLPYPQVLTQVHRAMAEQFGMKTTDELDNEFGGSVPHWPAFPDSAESLRHLKMGYRLVVLSNIDRKSFWASNRKLGVEFDAVYTAEEIGSYKPNPANFVYMLAALSESFGFERRDVLHTAQSLFHDHVPAIGCGLATAWIDRHGLTRGGNWGATPEVQERPVTDYVFFSMADMAMAVST
jgi:2-haloacid dehalogenase